MNISYIISSNNNNFNKTQLTIDSIHYQYRNVKYTYEIIVCGLLEDRLINKIDYFLLDEFGASNGYVGRLRNLGADRSKYPNLVFIDDDIILNHDWLVYTINFNADWLVLGNRIYNIDGTRFWDRCRRTPQHKLVNYKTISSPKLYQTSGFMLIKKHLLETIRWSETAKIHSETPEDILYSKCLHENKIPLYFNQKALVWHNSDMYTQSGDVVIKQKTYPCADFLDNINIINDIIKS